MTQQTKRNFTTKSAADMPPPNGEAHDGPELLPPPAPMQMQQRQQENPPGTDIRFNDFTPAQIETIQPILQQIQQAQQFIGFFLGYVGKENKLPEAEGGWHLYLDPQNPGTPPRMRGFVKT